VALDFETTGLDLRTDTIVSFGTVPLNAGRIDVGQAVHQLVDPGSVDVSAISVTIHGLRPLDLREAPPVEVVAELLRRQLDGRVILAWWAPIEAGFLDRLFGGGISGWMRWIVDVRDLLLLIDGDDASTLTLAAAAERHGVPVASPHDALDDAMVTAQLFLVLATRLEERARSIRDLQGLAPKRGSHGFR
jgi:DNA polymerase-3 subunit epsilon